MPVLIMLAVSLYLLLRSYEFGMMPGIIALVLAAILSVPAGFIAEYMAGPARTEYVAVESLECFSDQNARWYAIAGSKRTKIEFTPGEPRAVYRYYGGRFWSWPVPYVEVQRSVELPSLAACRRGF